MSTAVTSLHILDDAHSALDLTFKQLAQLLRADESTLQRWRTGITEPSPVFLHRLEALEELLIEARRTFRSSAAIRRWLGSKIPAFGDRRPIDLLLEGRLEGVTASLQAFNVGMTT